MKVVTYFSDFWNIVDVATVMLYVIGYTIRIVDHEFNVTQVSIYIFKSPIYFLITETLTCTLANCIC